MSLSHVAVSKQICIDLYQISYVCVNIYFAHKSLKTAIRLMFSKFVLERLNGATNGRRPYARSRKLVGYPQLLRYHLDTISHCRHSDTWLIIYAVFRVLVPDIIFATPKSSLKYESCFFFQVSLWSQIIFGWYFNKTPRDAETIYFETRFVFWYIFRSFFNFHLIKMAETSSGIYISAPGKAILFGEHAVVYGRVKTCFS